MAIPSSGKWYAEFTCDALATTMRIGIWGGQDSASREMRTYLNDDNKQTDDAASVAYGNAATYTASDVIGVAVDMDNGAIWFSKNDSWIDGNGSDSSATVKAEIEAGTTSSAAFTDLISSGNTWHFWFAAGANTGNYGTFNAGQHAFSGSAPNGFKTLNSANLPDPAIVGRGECPHWGGLPAGSGVGEAAQCRGCGTRPDRQCAWSHQGTELR
jgi:hypothetical protein